MARWQEKCINKGTILRRYQTYRRQNQRTTNETRYKRLKSYADMTFYTARLTMCHHKLPKTIDTSFSLWGLKCMQFAHARPAMSRYNTICVYAFSLSISDPALCVFDKYYCGTLKTACMCQAFSRLAPKCIVFVFDIICWFWPFN